jgi:hypothetical protein
VAGWPSPLGSRPGLASLREEATLALATFDSKRRVFATATAPTT